MSELRSLTHFVCEGQPSFLLNGEVIWQASDSPLSKELQGLTLMMFSGPAKHERRVENRHRIGSSKLYRPQGGNQHSSYRL